jgi:hypothetical protein
MNLLIFFGVEVNGFAEGDERHLGDEVRHDQHLRAEVHLADVLQQSADQKLKDFFPLFLHYFYSDITARRENFIHRGSISPNFFAERKDSYAQRLANNLPFKFTNIILQNCAAKFAKFTT